MVCLFITKSDLKVKIIQLCKKNILDDYLNLAANIINQQHSYAHYISHLRQHNKNE